MYNYFNLSVYISRDFSLPLAIEMHGRPFFPGHHCIENTTVLSDYLYFFWHTRRNINKYERKQMNVSTILAYVHT